MSPVSPFAAADGENLSHGSLARPSIVLYGTIALTRFGGRIIREDGVRGTESANMEADRGAAQQTKY